MAVCVCIILLILDIKLVASNETSVDISLNISLKFPSDTNLVMTCNKVTLEPLIVCCVLTDFFLGGGGGGSGVRFRYKQLEEY